MKIAKQDGLSRWMQRVGVGVTALVLAATFSMPTSAVAKEKASKVTASKKVSKKVSKKLSSKVSKKASKPKIQAKKSKVAKSKSLAKHHTSVTKHRSSLSKHHKSALKKRSRKTTELSSQYEWNASQDPKQPYYVIPASVAGDVASPQQQPDFLQPAATSPQNYQADAPEPDQPAAKSGKVHQVGTASYYSDKFDGGRTASGERFDQDKLTCAHGSLPFGCKLRVTNMRNNKAVEVKVNDRGGFHKYGRVIDLSKAAAKEIGMMGSGTAKVKVEIVPE